MVTVRNSESTSHEYSSQQCKHNIRNTQTFLCGDNCQLTLPESILEASRQVLQVPHATRACGLTPDRLLAPLVCIASTTMTESRIHAVVCWTMHLQAAALLLWLMYLTVAVAAV